MELFGKKKIGLDDYLSSLWEPGTPLDEIGLLIFSRMYHIHIKVLLKGYFWIALNDEGIEDWNAAFVYHSGLVFESTTRKVYEIEDDSEPEIPTKKPKLSKNVDDKPKPKTTLNSMKAGILDENVIAELKKLHQLDNKEKDIMDKSDDNTMPNNLDVNTKQSKGSKGTMQIKTHVLKKCFKKPKAIKCPAGCAQVFSSHKDTNEHVKGAHPNFKFVCQYCSHEFETYNAKYKHKKANGTLPHACSHCDKRFQFPMELTEHEHVHTHQDLIPCANCPQKFTTKWGMKLHAKVHQGYLFQCDHCKYNSTSQSNLDQHIQGHHGEKFPTLCGEVYSWRHQVTTHQEGCVKCIQITTEQEKACKKLAAKVDRKCKH